MSEDCCRSAHSSGSQGAVSSVRLRHFSGKLRGDIYLVRGSSGTERTVSNQSEKGHWAHSEELSQCCKTQCARRREQLARPNMNSGKTECLEAHEVSVIHPTIPRLGGSGACKHRHRIKSARTSSANAKSAASVQLSCFPLSLDVVCPAWRASRAIRL
jgi:hypothetical protein